MSKGGGRVIQQPPCDHDYTCCCTLNIQEEYGPYEDVHPVEYFERKSNRDARWHTFKAMLIVIPLLLGLAVLVRSVFDEKPKPAIEWQVE